MAYLAPSWLWSGQALVLPGDTYSVSRPTWRTGPACAVQAPFLARCVAAVAGLVGAGVMIHGNAGPDALVVTPIEAEWTSDQPYAACMPMRCHVTDWPLPFRLPDDVTEKVER
jgi:hypothetical protein